MAIEPIGDDYVHSGKTESQRIASEKKNYDAYSDCESCFSEEEYGSDERNTAHVKKNTPRLAIACDDGCIRIYNVSDLDGLTYIRSFPRVSG